ncbi:MAG: 50S ribosomal protein L25 [Acidimicrobiia bacterium]|nr:50S ribosomal protein L25 [Acidimicrobiia bacterium]
MADITLAAEIRTDLGSRPAGRLRRAGRLPAVVYGHKVDPVSVTVSARELEHILHGQSGANTLITLNLEGGEALALARQIQRHATRGDLVHVDFVRVSRDETVRAEVPLHSEGDAPGVREGGLLEQLIFHVSVEAKPGDIPTEIVFDISGLALSDQLRIADLTVPRGVALLHDAGALVAQVTIPRGMADEEGEGAEDEEGEAEADADADAPSTPDSGESEEG